MAEDQAVSSAYPMNQNQSKITKSFTKTDMDFIQDSKLLPWKLQTDETH